MSTNETNAGQSQELSIEKSILLKASPEKVWDFLTDPDKMALWFHRPNVAFTEGAEYAMYKESDGSIFMSGKILVAEKPNRLVYEFHIAPMGDAISTVNWTIKEVTGGTRLSLIHTGLPKGESAFELLINLDEGWDEHIARMRNDIKKT
jgi:uncharacterized protein YndB with AHSA1/START domain